MRNTEGVAGVRRKLEVLQSHCHRRAAPTRKSCGPTSRSKLVIGQTDAAAEQKLAAILASPSTSPGTRRSHRSAFVVGSPETVAAHYRAIAAVGIQYFVVQVDAAETETLDLLAAEVVPRVG
jgi:alkanesulfonate monooxygenase SsuD/methylene tetrahydromethanopterin reductase-like flavin-dependent oxidoreductase (luciferase family)